MTDNTISAAVAEQIEKAFDFRGHVTVSFTDGRAIEGFLFNREISPAQGEPYIELIRKDSDERLRFPSREVRAIALSGKDCAVPFTPPPK